MPGETEVCIKICELLNELTPTRVVSLCVGILQSALQQFEAQEMPADELLKMRNAIMHHIMEKSCERAEINA